MGLTSDLQRTYMGVTWEVLGKYKTIHVFLKKYKTIHVLLKNDREIQVILQIINFFFVFSIKIHNFAKKQTFNSNNYGEFQ